MTKSPPLRDRVAAAAGSSAGRERHLATGNAARLVVFELTDRRRVVAKMGPGMALEGWMLRLLAERSALPVPRVYLADDDLLVMDHVPGGGAMTTAAERHAAELLAALHSIPVNTYGFERDTVIGPLRQPNPPADDWIAFFRDHRLRHMADQALQEGAVSAALRDRIERLAARLDGLIGAPSPPSLIHGDVWGGNVLVSGDRISGFIDPALHHADAEIELAFSTLFSTFGEVFFRRYAEIRPIRPGFFEARRDLYNLYPLLVHVRLFGGSYVGAVERIVRRFVG